MDDIDKRKSYGRNDIIDADFHYSFPAFMRLPTHIYFHIIYVYKSLDIRFGMNHLENDLNTVGYIMNRFDRPRITSYQESTVFRKQWKRARETRPEKVKQSVSSHTSQHSLN